MHKNGENADLPPESACGLNKNFLASLKYRKGCGIRALAVIRNCYYLTHSTSGTVADRFSKLTSKFAGAARLVNVFLLMNLRGIAARASVSKVETHM